MSLSLSEYKTAINTKDDVGSLVCSLYVEYYIRRVVCSRDSEPNDKDWNERYALFPSYLFFVDVLDLVKNIPWRYDEKDNKVGDNTEKDMHVRLHDYYYFVEIRTWDETGWPINWIL